MQIWGPICVLIDTHLWRVPFRKHAARLKRGGAASASYLEPPLRRFVQCGVQG